MSDTGVISFYGIGLKDYKMELITTEYKIHNKKIPVDFEGFRMVVLSDLHNQCFGEENADLIARIHACEPDIIIGAGDLLVGKPDEPFDTAIHLLKELVDAYPIYLALGNHEYRMKIYPDTYKDAWERYYQETTDLGCIWLDNETIYLDRGSQAIAMTGLSMDAYYYKRFYKRKMSDAYLSELIPFDNRDVFQILLAHNPEYFPEYATYGSDLVISGHVHGGIVRLPGIGGLISPMLKPFPKYDAGKFEEANSVMLLSAGLGSHTIKLRINNPAELMVVTLHCV